jgi:hypothetical protein
VTEIKDVLGAVSLSFTVLAFFAGRRIDKYKPDEITSLDAMAVLQAVLDLALACVSVLVIVILWPLLEDSGAFGSFSQPDDVLPNLLAVIVAGFGVIAVIEGFLGVTRLFGGLFLKSLWWGLLGVGAVVAVIAVVLAVVLG